MRPPLQGKRRLLGGRPPQQEQQQRQALTYAQPQRWRILRSSSQQLGRKNSLLVLITFLVIICTLQIVSRTSLDETYFLASSLLFQEGVGGDEVFRSKQNITDKVERNPSRAGSPMMNEEFYQENQPYVSMATSEAGTDSESSVLTKTEGERTGRGAISIKDREQLLYHQSPLANQPELQSHRKACESSLRRGFFSWIAPVPYEKWKFMTSMECRPQSTLAIQEWQRRVPSTIILGTQKGGTTTLANYLFQHPSIVDLHMKELHALSVHMDHGSSQTTASAILNQTELLQYYQQEVIAAKTNLSQFVNDTNLHVLDATPNYLFASDRVFDRLFCAAPWAKLIVLLRHPIDRAFSQYHMHYRRDSRHHQFRKHGNLMSFETFVDLDMAVLKELGIVREDGGVPINDKLFSAWAEYTKWGLNSPLGRGLYWIQIKQLFDKMEQYQKPRSDVFILQSERFRKDPNTTYHQVIEFLGWESHQLPTYEKLNNAQYFGRKVENSTREKLEKFYAPYISKLADLLGDEWRGVWD